MRIFITALVYLISMSMFGQLSNESILVDGLNRTYLPYLPSGFNMNETNSIDDTERSKFVRACLVHVPFDGWSQSNGKRY